MSRRIRAGFTLFQLLVILALAMIFFAMMLPAILKARLAAARAQSFNNLKQMGLACHNYHDVHGSFPPGNDANNYSAAAHLLPFVEQNNLYQMIDFKKPVSDPANNPVRGVVVMTFLSPRDPLRTAKPGQGATNYLFSAGSRPDLEKDDGVFYQDSKTKIADITDGLSNTLMAGETLKGDGSTRAVSVSRQYVRLGKDALAGLNEEAGVQEFQANKDIAGDRCASWLDGRFLQGTFTGTRLPNDSRPDVSCGGVGGLSALRSLDDFTGVLFCDGSVRALMAAKMKPETWKALVTRAGGELVKPDF